MTHGAMVGQAVAEMAVAEMGGQAVAEMGDISRINFF